MYLINEHLYLVITGGLHKKLVKMGDMNKRPGDSSEQKVIFLSDSSSEEEILHIPGRNVVTDMSDAKQNNKLSEGNTGSDEALNQVNQLIDWINRYDSQRAEPSTSLRNVFAGGFHFIQNLRSKFEEAHNAIITKDVEISEGNGEIDSLKEENEELRRQLEARMGELEKLKRRNARLEEERRQRKADGMSLGKMRSKVDNLQFVFERLVDKMEKEPVDHMDPLSVQKKHELEVFQRDVGALFNKVQYKLRKWEMNQRDMEGELESTKLALDRLNEMVLLGDMKRARQRGTETEESSRVVEPAPSGEELMPPPPPLVEPSTSKSLTHPKKKKMYPPPLLPLTREEAQPPPQPQQIPVFVRPAVPSFQQQQQVDLEMLASALSRLHHVQQSSVSMETATPTPPPKIFQRINLNVVPPPPPNFNFPAPPPQKHLFPNGPVRAALSQHIQSQNARKSRQASASLSKVPPPPSSQYSQQYFNQPQEPQPSTSRGLPGRSAGYSTMPSHSKYKKIAPYPTTRAKGAKPKTSSFTTSSAGGEAVVNGPVNDQNVLPSSNDGVPPTAHSSNAGSTKDGENPDAETPTGGLNICGLCGAAYNTLVQLKLHHTVVQ